MRYLAIIVMVFLSLQVFSQNRYVGKWYNYFGESFLLNSDSTFNYRYRFDLIADVSQGNWMAFNDTIFFTFQDVYDTLIEYDTNVLIINDKEELIITKNERLVFSFDDESQTYFNIDSTDLLICCPKSGPRPEKLFYKNDRLIKIDDNGQLETKKVRGFWSGKKYKPYYLKEN